jgi:hypothetical protein
MANVFAKVFSQIFDSTIAEDYKVRHVFMDLLVMADSDGVVDKTPEAIARIANVPLSLVKSGIAALASPDAASRTKDHDGCRIQLIDEKRDWGWRIVNFQKYREIRDEEARRIANRSYKRDERKRKRESQQQSALCPDNQLCHPRSAHTEGEVEGEVKIKSVERPTLEQVQAYCAERQNHIDPQQWFDYYTSNGWKVGRCTMKDWKASIRTWERNGFNGSTGVVWRGRDGSVPSKAEQRVARNQQRLVDELGLGEMLKPVREDLQNGASRGREPVVGKMLGRGTGGSD